MGTQSIAYGIWYPALASAGGSSTPSLVCNLHLQQTELK
jgi:hypothetical protein